MTAGGLDPVIAHTVSLALALLLAFAAIHKLRAPAQFRAAVADYRLVPRRLLSPAVAAIVAAEVGSTLALVLPPLRVAGGSAAAALLSAYAVAIAINLGRGRRHIDCGCSGAAGRRPLSAVLLWRNALLVLAALLAAAPATQRALNAVDVLSIAGGVAVLALLYAAADAMLANAAGALRLHPLGEVEHA